MEHLGNAARKERSIKSCHFNNIIVFGCRGCVGEQEEHCLSLDHHPGDAVEQPSGWEDQEHFML